MSIGVTKRGFLKLAIAGAATATLPMPAILAQKANEPATIRVATVPYVSGGPHFIAKARGYFEKVGLTVEETSFVDGSAAMPMIAAGELDIAPATAGAAYFNMVAKGNAVKMFLAGSQEAPGLGSLPILVSRQLHEAGLRGLGDFAQLKGKTVAVAAVGSIAQYLFYKALDRAGVSEKDVEWRWGMNGQTALQVMPSGQIAAVLYPLPGAYAAEASGAAKIVTWSDEIAPGVQLSCSAASETFLKEKADAAVRYCMALLQGQQDYAAAAKDGNPDVLRIIADATRLSPELVDAARPRWSSQVPNGLPDTGSVMEQQAFWHKRTDLLRQTVAEDQIFDLTAAKLAYERLTDKNPFL